MSKAAQAALAAIVLTAAACSSGSAPVVAPTTTTAPATTAAPTTTTLSQEEQVKAAYLAYWHMVDRLSAAPDPDDPELPRRSAEPLLSFLRDDFSLRATQGRVTRYPVDAALNSHHVESVRVLPDSAQVTDCFTDGRIAVSADGSSDADVITKLTTSTLVLSNGAWLASDVHFSEASGCGSGG